MSEPITITQEDLQNIVDRSIDRTLVALGIKKSTVKPYISQNQAAKLVGRKRLETAMRNGTVAWKKPDYDKKTGRVWVSHKDIQKLLNNPTI